MQLNRQVRCDTAAVAKFVMLLLQVVRFDLGHQPIHFFKERLLVEVPTEVLGSFTVRTLSFGDDVVEGKHLCLYMVVGS